VRELRNAVERAFIQPERPLEVLATAEPSAAAAPVFPILDERGKIALLRDARRNTTHAATPRTRSKAFTFSTFSAGPPAASRVPPRWPPSHAKCCIA
jgi:hypothetical protein